MVKVGMCLMFNFWLGEYLEYISFLFSEVHGNRPDQGVPKRLKDVLTVVKTMHKAIDVRLFLLSMIRFVDGCL